MEEEINRAASLLKGLPRGYMPKPLFYAMAEKIVLPTVELMVFRRAKTGVELLLTQRLNNDPYCCQLAGIYQVQYCWLRTRRETTLVRSSVS